MCPLPPFGDMTCPIFLRNRFQILPLDLHVLGPNLPAGLLSFSFSLSLSFFFFFFFDFLPLLEPLLRHLEVPRLGVASEL